MVNAPTTISLREALDAEARALGFAACGVAPAAEDGQAALRLQTWLDEGMHGSMGWMEERFHHRRGPQALWSEARSVIALGMSYAPAADPLALAANAAAQVHLAASLPHVAGDYMGEHWLASFALLALTAGEGA